MTYYFSGIDRAKFIEILAREGAAGMVNYEVVSQPAMIAACERWPEVPLVLDSNIFRKHDNVTDYIDICHRYGSRFDWVANFDVLGDQRSSNDNWHKMIDAGIKALWVYQVQGGADLDEMQEYASELKFIGIGGLVSMIKANRGKALALINDIGKLLNNCGAKCHLFGVNSPLIIREVSSLPWFKSADSQAWLCGFKANELITRSGQRMSARHSGLHFSREECATQNIRSIHSWMSANALQLSFEW